MNDLKPEEIWIDEITSKSIKMVVSCVVEKIIDDSDISRIIKIATLQHKMSQNRKRRNSKSYVRWSVRRRCKNYVEYDI